MRRWEAKRGSGWVVAVAILTGCAGPVGLSPSAVSPARSVQTGSRNKALHARMLFSTRSSSLSFENSDATILYNFLSSPSQPEVFDPVGSLAQDSKGNILGITTQDAACPSCTGATYELSGSSLSVIHRFKYSNSGSDGLFPKVGLVSPDGGEHFFGTTEGNNSSSSSGCGIECGTLYEVTAGASGYSYSRAGI